MPSAPQAGQRTLSFSVSWIMASTTFIKDTGILCPLLLGLLLPSVLVSGQTTLLSTASTAAPTTTMVSTTSQSSTTMAPATTTATQSPTTTASATTTTNQISTTMAPTTTSTTNQSPTTTASSTSTTKQSPTTMASTTTTSSSSTTTSTTTSAVTQSTTSTSTGASSTTMSQSNTSMTTSNWTSSISTGGMYVINGTTMANTNSMSMLYCPSFMCNSSDCYTMYTNQNTTSCSVGDCCQLLRLDNICYTVGCTPSCAASCVNASQVNCSVNCCNSTGCLNDSFVSMMMTTTTMAMTATKTTPVPTTTTTSPPTTANNGNKCHNGMCTGADCYTSFTDAPLQICSASHPHCQLKKETVDSALKWSAGCTNCSVHTACKASTQPPCNLECCNATMSSCLWLNGTLNVPSFATRGPYLHTELIASSLCLLAITLMM